jgi:hypothetical protein
MRRPSPVSSSQAASRAAPLVSKASNRAWAPKPGDAPSSSKPQMISVGQLPDHSLHQRRLDTADRAEVVDDVGVDHAGGLGHVGQLQRLRALLDQDGLGGGEDVLARGFRRTAHAGFRNGRFY